MTLFIQSDGGTTGTGSVFPDRAGADLLAISNLDTGYGENPVAGTNRIEVTYARTQNGPCPTRLDQLVNTDFAGTAGTVDILVVAADINFTLNDGSMLAGGFNIPPNAMSGSVNLNPSNSSVVLYDTSDNGGTGVCLRREGGDLDLESPASVILYHELSHALRTCTNATLDRTETDCSNASDEEAAAITDENDMRNQLGIARRQPDDHCGNLGCTSTCCILTSIACGSPFAQEVNALRDIRDRALRKSEIGFDFFDRLFVDYYQFSPRVVDLMGGDPTLRTFIRTYFVRPLIAALQLFHAHTVSHVPPEELERRLDLAVREWPEVGALGVTDLAALRQILSPGSDRGALARLPYSASALNEMATLLDARALTSPYVKWALVDVMMILVQALEWRAAGTSEGGRRLAAAIDSWSTRMPISPIWAQLSRHEIAEGLEFLRRTLLRESWGQRLFASRLVEAFPHSARIKDATSRFAERDSS
jgi:hypothetical protein